MLNWLIERTAKWFRFAAKHYRQHTVAKFRARAAEGVRNSPHQARMAFVAVCALIFLLGIIVAGFALLPVALTAIVYVLVRPEMHPALVAGIVLLACSLAYILIAAIVLRLAATAVFRDLDRRAEAAARWVAGTKQ